MIRIWDRRLVLNFIHVVFIFWVIQGYSQENLYSIAIDNITLMDALEKVSHETGYGLTLGSFENPLEKVTAAYQLKTLDHILSDLLAGTTYSYTLKNDRIIIRRIKIDDKDSSQPNTAPASFTISGYISDSLSGESLIGANILCRETGQGTSSNLYGFYSLSLPLGPKTLVFTYIGYEEKIVRLNVHQDQRIQMKMLAGNILNEIVITHDSESGMEQQTRMSHLTLPLKSMKVLPVIGGEVDIIKTYQLMPGVQSGNEGFAGLHVRGGSADQNLIMLDGVPVYNSSHLFGLFSIFNTDAIHSSDLIKGGFPARYGGRLSSILDIRLKEGNRNEWNGQGSIGLISSKFTIEGPVLKDKMTLMLSLRRTYADLLARPFIKKEYRKEHTDGNLAYHFIDFMGKTNYRISDKNRIYLSLYSGGDQFSENTRDGEAGTNVFDLSSTGLNWGNLIASFRWNHLFNNRLFSNVTLSRTKYNFSVFTESQSSGPDSNGELQENSEYFNYRSKVSDWAMKWDFDYLPGSNHTVKFGVEYVHHNFLPGVTAIRQDNLFASQNLTISGRRILANKWMGYVEDDIELSRTFSLNLGFNGSLFEVDDEIYSSLEPRILSRYHINDRLAVKASYTHMTQYLHLLTNSGIGLPTDLWLPPTGNVAPQRAKQYALGMVQKAHGDLELTVEAYYKEIDDMVTYKEGASFLQNSNDWESKVTPGQGWSKGAEFMLNKKSGPLIGWLAYTFSHTDRKFAEINGGRKYPYKYDRRHDLSVVLNYKLSDNITIGGNWVYATGLAATLPIRKFTEGEIFISNRLNDYGSKNSFRFKPYHRLDLSVSFHKKSGWAVQSFHIDIYNAYNRLNTFYIRPVIEFGEQDHREKLEEVTLLPIIPSFRWDISF